MFRAGLLLIIGRINSV